MNKQANFQKICDLKIDDLHRYPKQNYLSIIDEHKYNLKLPRIVKTRSALFSEFCIKQALNSSKISEEYI